MCESQEYWSYQSRQRCCRLSAGGSYKEGFHFEVDQLDSIEVHLVVDVVNSSYIGANLRNTHIYVRKQSMTSSVSYITHNWTKHSPVIRKNCWYWYFITTYTTE